MKGNFKLPSLLGSLELFSKHALRYQHSGTNKLFLEDKISINASSKACHGGTLLLTNGRIF